MPAAKLIPDSGKPPFGSALTVGVNVFDLKAHGYVEEEYYLSGNAAARDESGGVLVANAPYVTRILVRRPIDPKRFSGNVIVTPFNWDRESAREWGFTRDHIASHGDVFIGVSLVRYDIPGFPLKNGIKMLQAYDPVRYGPLKVFDDKSDKRQDLPQSQDILAQLALMLKSNSAAGPLKGMKVKSIIAYSEGVLAPILENFIAQGRHDDTRMPSGAPLFDGYIVGAYQLLPVPPAAKRSDAAFALVQDERELHRDNVDKLVMPPDTDKPKFRFYDFVGAPHIGMVLADLKTGVWDMGNNTPEVPVAPPPSGGPPPGGPPGASRAGPPGGGGGPPGGRPAGGGPPGGGPGGKRDAICSSLNNEPVGLVFSALLKDMETWIDGGPPMPRAPRVDRAADGSGEQLDGQTGNAQGGLRPPWITVPAATYFPGSVKGCGIFEPMSKYSGAKLRALYGDYDAYVRAFETAKVQFVKDGYMLADQAADLHPTATRADFQAP